jgi:hypothetical protein
MKVLIALLLVSVLLGAHPRGRAVRERPVLLLGLCAIVGASFLSLRVIG